MSLYALSTPCGGTAWAGAEPHSTVSGGGHEEGKEGDLWVQLMRVADHLEQGMVLRLAVDVPVPGRPLGFRQARPAVKTKRLPPKNQHKTTRKGGERVKAWRDIQNGPKTARQGLRGHAVLVAAPNYRRGAACAGGVEDLVPAMLGVDLGEHHQLHVGGVAVQPRRPEAVRRVEGVGARVTQHHTQVDTP